MSSTVLGKMETHCAPLLTSCGFQGNWTERMNAAQLSGWAYVFERKPLSAERTCRLPQSLI